MIVIQITSLFQDRLKPFITSTPLKIPINLILFSGLSRIQQVTVGLKI